MGVNYPVVDVYRLNNALVLDVDGSVWLWCSFLARRLLSFHLQLLLQPHTTAPSSTEHQEPTTYLNTVQLMQQQQ